MIQFIDTERKCIYTYLFLERQEDFNKQVMLYINGRFVSKTINKKKLSQLTKNYRVNFNFHISG